MLDRVDRVVPAPDCAGQRRAKWSMEQVEQLRALVADKVATVTIARILGRTQAAVLQKMTLSGIRRRGITMQPPPA